MLSLQNCYQVYSVHINQICKKKIFIHSNFLFFLCEIQIQETREQLLLLTLLTKQSQVTRECRLVLPATAVQLDRTFVVIAISTMKELQRAEIANKQHKERGLFFPPSPISF